MPSIRVGDIVCLDGDDAGTALGLGLVTRIHIPRGRTSQVRTLDVLWSNGSHYMGIQSSSLLIVNSAGYP